MIVSGSLPGDIRSMSDRSPSVRSVKLEVLEDSGEIGDSRSYPSSPEGDRRLPTPEVAAEGKLEEQWEVWDSFRCLLTSSSEPDMWFSSPEPEWDTVITGILEPDADLRSGGVCPGKSYTGVATGSRVLDTSSLLSCSIGVAIPPLTIPPLTSSLDFFLFLKTSHFGRPLDAAFGLGDLSGSELAWDLGEVGLLGRERCFRKPFLSLTLTGLEGALLVDFSNAAAAAGMANGTVVDRELRTRGSVACGFRVRLKCIKESGGFRAAIIVVRDVDSSHNKGP